MKDSARHEKTADEEEIKKTPNGERSDKCAEHRDSFGILNDEEIAGFAGFVFDKCTIGSAMVSEGVSRGTLNMHRAEESREFEFDLSHLALNVRTPSFELDSVESPADELFYKGRLLPLYAPLRIQMVEKLEKSERSESQQNILEACAETQTKNIGNSDNISGTKSDCEKLGFQSPCKSSDVDPSKVDKEVNESDNKDTQEALGHSQGKTLPDSGQPQSQLAPVRTHKLKASKAFVKSLFTKASNTRGANDHHSQNGIISIKESVHEMAAPIRKRIPLEKPPATYRKSFSGSFSFIKGSLLIRKLNSKSLSSPNSESPTSSTSGFRKRSMSCALSDQEDGIEGAIAHCKESHSADPMNAINAPKSLPRTTSNPERYARGHGRRF